MGLAYKLNVEFEDDEAGNPAHPPLVIAVSKNLVITDVAAAMAHCTESIGVFGYPDGTVKSIMRIHHKDSVTGEMFNLKTCKPVRDEAFDESEAPRVRSLNDAPKKIIP